MLHLLKSYLKFLWNSKNAHGLHSPFVYRLVSRCFYDTMAYPEYNLLKQYRKGLQENTEVLEVTDFGAGSRVFTSNRRTVQQIASNAGITAKNGELLFRLSRYFEPQNILEIGTSLGLSTAALATGSPKATIISLEGCPVTAQKAREELAKYDFTNVSVHTTAFSTYFTMLPKTISYDFVYFDGNHQKQATLAYFEQLLPTASNDTVWIFDDIHWSPGMEEAWEILKKHPKVSVTIDTFQWGIVFFRREQEKQHFVIRAASSKFLDTFLGIRKLWGLLD